MENKTKQIDWEIENLKIKKAIVEKLEIKPERVKVENSSDFDIRITIANCTYLSDDNMIDLQKAILSINKHFNIKKWVIASTFENGEFDLTVWC